MMENALKPAIIDMPSVTITDKYLSDSGFHVNALGLPSSKLFR